MENIRIRFAKLEDAQDISNIYEPYITDTAITFEYDPVPAEEFEGRIKEVQKRLPWLVCEIDNKIAGYAYCAPYKSRAAFAWDVEIAIYIDKNYHRRNIGKAFYECLFQMMNLQGYYNIYAMITVNNESSAKLHETMGFRKVGVYEKTGYKFGTWWDLLIMVKEIGDFTIEPTAIKSIHEIDHKVLEDIMMDSTKYIRSNS